MLEHASPCVVAVVVEAGDAKRDRAQSPRVESSNCCCCDCCCDPDSDSEPKAAWARVKEAMFADGYPW